jgi:tetratricopeptide (TPR) repeat protein
MPRLVSVLTVLLILTGSACTRSARYYTDKGKQLFAEGKYSDADLNFRKARQIDPKYGDAYYQLGLVALEMKKPTDAYLALARAVELMPSRDDVKLKLADLSLTAYMADSHRPRPLYERVNDLSNQLAGKNPDSYDAMRLKGYLAMTDHHYQEAEEYFRKANDAKAMQPEVIMGWTQVLFLDKQAAEGEKLALQSIEKNKSYGPIYDVLYQHYMLLNRIADAEKILKAKVSNNPTESRNVLQLAMFYASTSRPDDMKAVLQTMLDNPKVFPDAHLHAGDFYVKVQHFDDALREYEQGVKGNAKEKIVYLKRIADVWLTQGKGEKASEVVREILKEQSGDEAARAVNASLALARGNPEMARQAVTEFQDLVNKDPDNAVWHYNLGRALAVSGDLDAARTQFQEAINKRYDFLQPRIGLAEVSRLKKDYNSAVRYANEILAVNPGLPGIRLLRAVSLVNLGKDAEARTELMDLDKAFPQNLEVQLQLAVLDLKGKKFKEAEARFRTLSQQNPGNARVMSGLVETYGGESALDKAFLLLQDELNKSPNSEAVRSLFADTAVRLGKYDLAIEQYKRLLVTKPQSVQLSIALGLAYRSKGDLPSAIATFQKARALAPRESLVADYLGETLASAGQIPEAIEVYRRSLELQPDNLAVMNNLAVLITDSGGNLDEAMKLAQVAMQKVPTQPDFADTLGWIYVKKNWNDSALQVFQGLTQKFPGNANYHYHFGMALLQKGDRRTAKTELQTALSMNPSPDVRQNIEAALARIGEV